MKRCFPMIACGVFLFGAQIASASQLYGVRFSDSTPLYLLNQATGSASEIGPTGFDGIGDLTSDTRPGSYRLWGIRINSNELLSIDPSTGAAALAAQLNSPNNITSIAFDPVSGKLYGNTTVGFGAPFDALYEIDPATGNSTFIGRILFSDVFALGFDQGGKLFGVADSTNELIGINTANGNGTLIAPLQVNSAFDIASRPEDNVMFLADSSTSRLWQLDTTNGALVDVGPYSGASPNIVGLAFSVVPEPSTLSLLATALLAAGCLAWRRCCRSR